MVLITVFTSPTCPHCPSAEKLAKEVEKEKDDVKTKIYSTATKEGKRKAQFYGVMSVPTIFVKGVNYPENIGFRGTPSKNDLLKAINVANGSDTFNSPKKESILLKIQKKLGIKIKL